MNTLVSQRLPLHNIKSSSSWMETIPTPYLSPTCNLLPKKTWRLQAEAKGFGTPSKKGSQNNTSSKKNDENNNKEEDDKLPQAVWDTMIVRILVSVGTPMATGISLLFIFNLLKEYKILEFPVWVPFLTTLLAFGTSTLGIAYGTLSTSLDPKKKGSLLGWEQVQQNWPEMWREQDERKR